MADIPHIDHVKPRSKIQTFILDIFERSTKTVYECLSNSGSTIGHCIQWVSGPCHVPCNGFFSTKTQEVQACADTFSVN